MQGLVIPIVAVLCGMAVNEAAAQEEPGLARREVNITTDSAKGWVPSREQERAVMDRVGAYYRAVDAGQFGDAYTMMSAGQSGAVSLDQFIRQGEQFRAQAGPLVQRSVLKVTWTKDPAAAPAPGEYAAVDFAARFALVDRDCGYVVLYQAPGGGAFMVMREEANVIDNATAAKTPAERLDVLWRRLSAHCPNYPQATVR